MSTKSDTKELGDDHHANKEQPKYEDHFPYEASQGRLYPHEFITSMAEEALVTGAKWLRANGIPDQVVELIQDAAFLEGCGANFKHGDFSGADMLFELLPLVTKAIADLGGTFSSSQSMANPREPLTTKETAGENRAPISRESQSTTDDISTVNNKIENMAAIGRQFHPDFIEALRTTAYETFFGWLKVNNAPFQAIYLFESITMLDHWVSGLRHNDLSTGDSSSMVETLPEITKEISVLGGVFRDCDHMDISTEAVKWQPEPAKEA